MGLKSKQCLDTTLRNAPWIVLGALLIVLFYAWIEDSSTLLDYVNAGVLVITLAVLTRYAYDTNRLAAVTEEQLRYQSTPVVSVSVDQRNLIINDSSTATPNPTVVFFVSNDSRYHIQVKVSIVLEYGEHKSVHPDRYYSGQTEWNIGPKENVKGNFKIFPFFESIKDTRESMIEKLKQQQQKLKIFVFCKYKKHEGADKSYSEIMSKTYELSYRKEADHLKTLDPTNGRRYLPFHWVLVFDSPPNEMRDLAWKAE